MRRTLAVLVAALAIAACKPDDPSWTGTYVATGTWDLAGPLANGRTVGDSVADLLVGQVVGLTGVPSLLEAQAEELLDGALRPHVKAVVDGRAPAELSPGGSVYQALALALAQVKVESTIELKKGLLPGSLDGSETFTAFEYQHDGKSYRLGAGELARAGATITSDWSGKERDGGILEIDPHGVEVRFGELVQRVADRTVDAAGQAALKTQVQSAVACEPIVARVFGAGQGLKITVAEWSYTLSNDQLRSACESAAPLLQERVLGLFAIDSTVEMGGKVAFLEATGELHSADGFGGIVAVAPRPIAPRLSVQFSAQRR